MLVNQEEKMGMDIVGRISARNKQIVDYCGAAAYLVFCLSFQFLVPRRMLH